MELLAEILLQFILEPFFFAYFDLAEKFFGDKKMKKGLEYFLKILCSIVSLTAILFIVVGCFWIFDEDPFKTYGTAMLIVGICFVSLHIILGLSAGGKRLIDEKRKEELSDRENFEASQSQPIVRFISSEEDDENGGGTD